MFSGRAEPLPLLFLYRRPALSGSGNSNLLDVVRQKVSEDIKDIATEHCFYIETTSALTPNEYALLKWLLSETFEQENFSSESFFAQHSALSTQHYIVETGPRMNFTTAWSTNAVSVCHACGLTKVTRIERSRRYRLISSQQLTVSGQKLTYFLNLIHDKMTECRYAERLTTFETRIEPEPV